MKKPMHAGRGFRTGPRGLKPAARAANAKGVFLRPGILSIGTIAWLVGVPALVGAQPVTGSANPPIRVVHRFDFDERGAGNLEDIPKYWEQLRPQGFPHYASGAFDYKVGRNAAPSFHLSSEGRNVAYHYSGPETRVRRNTDYRIEGFVRGDRLQHARACLSAHFLDRYGRPIPKTLVRTRYIGGPDESDGWVKVELYLPAAPAEAYTIGFSAWLLQRHLWSTSVPGPRHIPRTDVRGGAWFDDITIYALPRAELTTGVPGNILDGGESQDLRVVLADNEDSTLYGRLTIKAADGGLVETHRIPVVIGAAVDPVRIPVGHLSPGLYHAELHVFTGETPILSRKVTFARLGRLYRGLEAAARPFGVVVDPRLRSDPKTELALLRQLAVRSVKLPVWTGLGEDPPTAQERRATDRLLQGLVKNGFGLTGVFSGPHSAFARRDGAYELPLIELLSGDPNTWKEHVAAVVAPYASAFRWWQVGPDRAVEEPTYPEDRLALAVTQLRDVMRPFITLPRLVVPATTAEEPAADKLPAEQIALAIGSEVQPDLFASRIEGIKKLGYEHVSTYVQPLPRDGYRRLPRLADWAQRIITARYSGADSVFVPQPWQVRETLQGRTTEPRETYLILRTIADVLADTLPGPRLRVAEGVRCLAFHDRESSILAMWDLKAPPGGGRHAIQLGRTDRQMDLWGRSTSLERDSQGRHIVRLSSMPVFIPDVERWLIDFRTSLVLKPVRVESGAELVQSRVEMAYRGERPVSGVVRLDVPQSWEVSPRTFSFSLMPQRVESHKVEIRFPHNEPAGQKEIVAKVTLSGQSYYLEIPLFLEVGVKDLDVSGLAVVEGTELLLRHVVTNRSAEVLSFRGSANVPGRKRQHRPISNLSPGETQIVEYRFARGDTLIGRNARLVLREVNDGPRTHSLELLIP